MKLHKNLLLAGNLVALVAAGLLCTLANAAEESASLKSSESRKAGDVPPGEQGTLPMRGVFNTFSNAFADWYASAYPQLQKFHNANSSYLPLNGGSFFKFPVFSGGPYYPIPIPASYSPPVTVMPIPGPAGTQRLHGSKTANSGASAGSGENPDAQAALATALISFYQYADAFINHLNAKLSPYLVHYAPAGFLPFLPPIPALAGAPLMPGTVVPTPIPPQACQSGDSSCGRPASAYPPLSVPLDNPPPPPSPVSTPVCQPGDGSCGRPATPNVPISVPFDEVFPAPQGPEMDISAIVELLGRFGGKLSSKHIVTLQPFMEQYLAKLSASSKMALKPLLSQYWPQLFLPTQAASQPAAPSQLRDEPQQEEENETS